MIDRSKRLVRDSRILLAVQSLIEGLEPRTFLTAVNGVVLGTPINTSTTGIGLSPIFANLADFNNDNKADLFVANSSANSVSVLLGNGDGSFSTTPDTIPVSGAPLPIIVADMNGDGIPDIIAGTTGSPTGDISIILANSDGSGHGNGTFQSAMNFPALGSNHAIAAAAFVDGGPMDIIDVSNNVSNVNNAALGIGDGHGNITSVQPFSLPFGNVAAVATGDFNHDGHQDFVVVNQGNNSVSVFLGNGDGTFKTPQTYATGPAPTSIVADDFNGDGATDLITADSTGGEVSFLAGNTTAGVANGTFAAPKNSTVAGSAVGGGPLKVRETVFTASGHKDLLVLLSSGSSGDATALLGNGDGTFHTGTIIATHGATRNAIAAGDLNGDGLTDVVVTDSSQITALLNTTLASMDTTPPTALVTANPPAGSTTTTVYDFTVTYTDNTQVDASTLGNGNLTVTFPDGTTTQAATLVSQNLGNAASVVATYSITFPSNLTTNQQGTYSVAVNASSVKDVVGNAMAAATIGTFGLTVSGTAADTTPPTGAVDASQAHGSTLSSVYDFTVTYSDDVSVDATTISNNNLIVTFPDLTTHAATLVSTGLTSGATVQAKYEVAFGALLTTADNGPYQVTINANSVKDTSGNAVAAGNIGAINLVVDANQPPVTPSGDFTVGAPTGKLLASVVTGAKQGSLKVTVVNGSSGIIAPTAAEAVTVTLYTSSSTIHDSTAVAVSQVVHKVKKLKVGKGFVVHFKAFNFPSTAGTYFLVADAALNGTLDSSDGTTPAITVAQAFVDASAVSVTPTKPTLVSGKKYTANFVVENIGNVPYNGPATVDVSLLPLGGVATSVATGIPLTLHLKPSQSKKIAVHFVASTLPAAGSYSLVLTIHMPGDTDSANDTATASVPVTI